MALYPDIQILLDLDNDGIPEYDISPYVSGNLAGDSGIRSISDTERLAATGSLSCALRNDALVSHLAGSNQLEGKAIEIRVTYLRWTKTIWYGYVQPQTKIDSADWGKQQASISAADWIQIANNAVVNGLTVMNNKRAEEAATILINLSPIPPLTTNFDRCELFTNVFDSLQQNTVVFSELDKLVKSELGYAYLRFRDGGETLRFEKRLARASTRALAQMRDTANVYHFQYSDGANSGDLIYNDGTNSGVFMADVFKDASFDRLMSSSEWMRGNNVVNDMTVSNVPRRVDGSDVVLYKTDQRIQMSAYTDFVVKGAWNRSDGGTAISASSVVTPLVSGTDYSLTENSDGTGTDYTSTLSLLSFVPEAGKFTATLRTAQTGWLYLQVRGKGIYKDNPVEYWIENQESKLELVRSVHADSLTREYSNNLITSKMFGNSVVALNRSPNKNMNSVTFCANYNEDLLFAFLYLDVGDKVQITESYPTHTGNYYIQGIRFTITTGGIIFFTWYLKESVETLCTPVAMKAPAL